jgi:hypothetical protein
MDKAQATHLKAMARKIREHAQALVDNMATLERDLSEETPTYPTFDTQLVTPTKQASRAIVRVIRDMTPRWKELTPVEQSLLECVEEYVIHRHADLTRHNVIGFDEEELERVQTDDHGYLKFSVEDLKIVEIAGEEGEPLPIFYVSAALSFKVNDGGEEIEGSTDTYQCYQTHVDQKPTWVIEWHSS